jgi:hypothetical protein
MTSASICHSVRWPKAPNALSNALRRMASNLRAVGIEIEFSRADVRGRHVVSLLRAFEPPKRSSVIVSRSSAALRSGNEPETRVWLNFLGATSKCSIDSDGVKSRLLLLTIFSDFDAAFRRSHCGQSRGEGSSLEGKSCSGSSQ